MINFACLRGGKRKKENGRENERNRGKGGMEEGVNGGGTSPFTLPYVSASACTNLQKV